MSVVTELRIPPGEFLLGKVLDEGPDAYVELERLVPTSGRIMPFFWVEAADHEEFERRVRNSPVVEDLVAIDHHENRVLYRATWTDEVHSLVCGIAETDATILEAHRDGSWMFRIRFDDHAGLTGFHSYCTEHDIDFELLRVYTPTDELAGGRAFDLTREQREALVMAVDRGYFEVPRRITLGNVADDLGISQQAASERIRRAADKVLRKALLERSVRDR